MKIRYLLLSAAALLCILLEGCASTGSISSKVIAQGAAIHAIIKGNSVSIGEEKSADTAGA